MWAFITINSLLEVLSLPHGRFGVCVSRQFSFVWRYLLVFLLTASLMPWLCRVCLISLFVDFPGFLLSLIYSVIPLWLEDTWHDFDLKFATTCFVILHNLSWRVFWVRLRRVSILLLMNRMCCIFFRCICPNVSLLIFCLNDVSIVQSGHWSPLHLLHYCLFLPLDLLVSA